MLIFNPLNEDDTMPRKLDIKRKKDTFVNKPVIIRHPNNLTANFIKWQFTAGENRILVKMLERIKHNQFTNEHPQIDIEDTVRLKFNWRELIQDNSNSNDRLKKDLGRLRAKEIQLPKKVSVDGQLVEGTILTGIISAAQWDKDQSQIEIMLSKEWYAFLIQLGPGYTSYNSGVSFNLSSRYNIKMYYFVSQWYNVGTKYLSIESFRKEFDIDPHTYLNKTASKFKEKIINPAKLILDKDADKSFYFEDVKQGRFIIGFKFHFYETGKHNVIIQDNEKLTDLLNTIDNTFRINREMKARIGGLCKKYSIDAVRNCFLKFVHEIIPMVQHQGKSPVDALQIIISREKVPLFEDINKSS